MDTWQKHGYTVTKADIYIKLFPKHLCITFGNKVYEHVWYLLKIENAALSAVQG